MICIKTKNKKIVAAAKDVAFLLEDRRFYEAISLTVFEGTTSTGDDIALYLQRVLALEDVIVYGYCKWWANELAVYKSSKPNSVGINKCRLKRSHASICGSIVHEIIHLVDRFIEDAEFGHPKKHTHNRDKTAPYRIGKIAMYLINEYY